MKRNGWRDLDTSTCYLHTTALPVGMASALVDVGLRNALADDDVALDTLLQPKGIIFKTITILVSALYHTLCAI